ncbi:MAG: flagellar motor protein MotD [Proteobacteria bacterium]|nr:flagellar motor protein MotD [Pseudomonadota bacterium]
MAGRRKRERQDDAPESHDRWLVSYADFITLLFAFFVVMYAISSVNESKYRVLAQALGQAFGGKIPQAPTVPDVSNIGNPIEPAPQPPLNRRQTAAQRQYNEALRRERQEMTSIARDIQEALSTLVDEGKVRVTQTDRGVKVDISAAILFAPGDATLTPESGVALRAIAKRLKTDTHDLQVEGHTDDIPINTTAFPSNWELSSARASSVVRLFRDNGVAESRMAAVGRAANFPVASNQTPEGRLRNRRVEVMIQATLPEQVTEVPITDGQGR